MHKLLKKAGATRISDEASDQLAETLERIGYQISRDAIDYAKHANRITVKARDIKLAEEKANL